MLLIDREGKGPLQSLASVDVIGKLSLDPDAPSEFFLQSSFMWCHPLHKATSVARNVESVTAAADGFPSQKKPLGFHKAPHS